MEPSKVQTKSLSSIQTKSAAPCVSDDHKPNSFMMRMTGSDMFVNVRKNEERQPVKRAQAPMTCGVILPSWEDLEEVEEKLDDALNELKKEKATSNALQAKLAKMEKIVSQEALRGTVDDENNVEKPTKEMKRIGWLMKKVDSLDRLCDDKDEIIHAQDMKLAWLRQQDKAMKTLQAQQKQLSASTTALLVKKKVTKMVDVHTIVFKTTEPSECVRDEMAEAVYRQRKEEHEKLVAVVDRIAAKYCMTGDRYDNVSIILTNKCADSIVPDELYGMWIHATEPNIEEEAFIMAPSSEELQKHEELLAKQIRMKPIYSPTLQKPQIQWTRLNTNMHRNLPQPMKSPLHGCSPDPAFYTDIVSTHEVMEWKRLLGGRDFRENLVVNYDNPLFEKKDPFGCAYGFYTDKGVVDLPPFPVHG